MIVPRATLVVRDAAGEACVDTVVLDYDARLLRRKRLEGAGGLAFLVDLPSVTHLDDGDAFALEDGRLIAVSAADEPLLRISGDLPRLAWHIGNRHTPCQILAGALLIRDDPVLSQMLHGLGAEITAETGPFTPEGGAYGHGRTMGHSHNHDAPDGHA